MKVYQRKKRRTESQIIDSSENPNPHSLPSSQQKKTRDLPKLTECHSCGFKVDICSNVDGKNALQPLYSEWRVVLLCSKCFSKVESSQICSYCFSETASSEIDSCFSCVQCRHSVHKSCFFDCKDTAPWSYTACLGSEFSVCVDCWIPKQLAISRRMRMMKAKGGMIKKKGSRVSSEKGKSRVLIESGDCRVLGAGDLVGSMEGLVNDVGRAEENKVETATRVREEAIKKGVVAKRAIKKADNGLRLAGNRKEVSQNVRSLKRDNVRVADGSAVTFEKHSHMICPPRISKSHCLLNTNCLDTSKSKAARDGSSSKTLSLGNAGGCDKHEVSNNDKLNEDADKSSFEPLVSLGSLDSDYSADPSHLCMGRSDSKCSSKDNVHVAEFHGEEEMLKEGEGSCSDRLINFTGEDSGLELDRKQADSGLHGKGSCNGQRDRYFLKYKRKKYRLKTNLDSGLELDRKQADYALHGEGRCNGQGDRYFLKYSRKNYRLKTNLDSGLEPDCKQADSEMHGEGICKGQRDRYFFKYSRKRYRLKTNLDSKPKILNDEICLESQDSAVRAPFNCSKEVKAISNASSQSFHATLQSSAHGSDISERHPRRVQESDAVKCETSNIVLGCVE
ncbi:PREDICTED: uncharacterized protein LOC109334274 isoform X2 [Lupinus angustifolius]|uniref:uncharacterized protein LOC109334274 isoform X2 n=1 Tax=Lupinus angustifolius TaxID=3871 RepID=UPI00092F7335|nr:PREDICTED: uncharacterized protein LOC109334274 isoform X2 [Lupinus angustifolius]